jgi:uncharacterized protein (DUF779 family)
MEPGNCFDDTADALQRIQQQHGYLTWHQDGAGKIEAVDTMGDSGGTVTFYTSKPDCDAHDPVPAGMGYGDVTVQDRDK